MNVTKYKNFPTELKVKSTKIVLLGFEREILLENSNFKF